MPRVRVGYTSPSQVYPYFEETTKTEWEDDEFEDRKKAVPEQQLSRFRDSTVLNPILDN